MHALTYIRDVYIWLFENRCYGNKSSTTVTY